MPNTTQPEPNPILEMFLKEGKRLCALDFETSKERFKLLLPKLHSRLNDAESGREFVEIVLLVFKLRCLSRRLGFKPCPVNCKLYDEAGISTMTVHFELPNCGPVCQAGLFGIVGDTAVFHSIDDETKRTMQIYMDSWLTAVDERIEADFCDSYEPGQPDYQVALMLQLQELNALCAKKRVQSKATASRIRHDTPSRQRKKKRIQKVRELAEYGLTQQQIADRLKVSEATIHRDLAAGDDD